MEQSDLFGTEKISKILRRLPVYRSQLPAAGYVADLSGIFPGGRIEPEKLAAYGDPHGCAVCAVGVYFFKIRTDMVLDDISGYGDGNNTGRSAVLPAVPCSKEKLRKGVRNIIDRTPLLFGFVKFDRRLTEFHVSNFRFLCYSYYDYKGGICHDIRRECLQGESQPESA